MRDAAQARPRTGKQTHGCKHYLEPSHSAAYISLYVCPTRTHARWGGVMKQRKQSVVRLRGGWALGLFCLWVAGFSPPRRTPAVTAVRTGYVYPNCQWNKVVCTCPASCGGVVPGSAARPRCGLCTHDHYGSLRAAPVQRRRKLREARKRPYTVYAALAAFLYDEACLLRATAERGLPRYPHLEPPRAGQGQRSLVEKKAKWSAHVLAPSADGLTTGLTFFWWIRRKIYHDGFWCGLGTCNAFPEGHGLRRCVAVPPSTPALGLSLCRRVIELYALCRHLGGWGRGRKRRGGGSAVWPGWGHEPFLPPLFPFFLLSLRVP